MALPIRTRTIPQCSACLRSYTWAGLAEAMADGSPAWRLQVRGKKKMVNNSANVTVKLLKDMQTYGKSGSYVPVSRGLMRNDWFKKRIAAYVTLPEMRALRASSTLMERDYNYGVEVEEDVLDAGSFESIPEPAPKPRRIEKLTPERSLELLSIFVPHRLDFYRQPIREEVEEAPKETPPPEEQRRSASSAAADLLQSRTQAAAKAKASQPLSIYGSVSTHDILLMVRAAIAVNDEAAKVILQEDDIRFVRGYTTQDIESGRIKRLGDFTVEIQVKGAEQGIRRTVRVLPQELQ